MYLYTRVPVQAFELLEVLLQYYAVVHSTEQNMTLATIHGVVLILNT